MAFLRGALLACALLGSAPAAAQTTYPDSSWREYLTTKINNKDECSTFETWQSTALPAALSGGATPIAIKLTTAYGDALCTTKAPEIVAKLAACTSSRCSDETWTCDGNFWSIGKCGKGIEIQAFLDGSSGKVCYCAGAAIVRPCIGNLNFAECRRDPPSQYLGVDVIFNYPKPTTTPTATPGPTATPTATPTVPPTALPTALPTPAPTSTPTSMPSSTPTISLVSIRVDLGSAGDFSVLSKSGITVTGGAASFITGDVGVSPIAATAMTGFALVLDRASDSSGQFSTSTSVTGKMFAADYGVPTPAKMTTAVLDMEAAYTDAAGRPNPDGARINYGGGILGGGAYGAQTAPLTPGVYTWGTDVKITGDIYLDAEDHPEAVFILQTSGSVIFDANFNVILVNGARADSVFWQVAGLVVAGAGAHLEGVFLVKTMAAFITGSSLTGRMLVQTAVTLQTTTIDASAAEIEAPMYGLRA